MYYVNKIILLKNKLLKVGYSMKLLDQVRDVIRKNIIVHHREHGKIRGNVGVKEKATHPPLTPPIVRLSSRRSQGRGIFSCRRHTLNSV